MSVPLINIYKLDILIELSVTSFDLLESSEARVTIKRIFNIPQPFFASQISFLKRPCYLQCPLPFLQSPLVAYFKYWIAYALKCCGLSTGWPDLAELCSSVMFQRCHVERLSVSTVRQRTASPPLRTLWHMKGFEILCAVSIMRTGGMRNDLCVSEPLRGPSHQLALWPRLQC